ncbi:GntR family transcriptional regulator [Paenibacillus bouchesdurhonensis]|uniref:GntR family transcriptional regulator n=1 Tax=Paenibacillus bouchesdurhonensis TaxID=1870990 RepID=UPI000DA605A5|nr:GntR family transcriptional regulator [Paenibacillus bouchesdurhonensis]
MAKKSLYLKVRDDLAEKIQNKMYKKGEFIPSESELEEEYKVSRTTIRTGLSYDRPRKGNPSVVL